MLRIKKELELYSETPEGREILKHIVLIDQAEIEIIKLNFKGIFIDISIK